MKKLLTVLFCVILVTGLMLTSCRREEPAPPAPAPTPAPVTPAPEPPPAPPEPEPVPEPPVVEVPVEEPAIEVTRVKAVDPDRPDRKTGGEFYIAVSDEPETLDPHMASSVPAQQLSMALFEGLVSYDPMTGRAVAGLAESWTVSADGLEYTFTLRDARWSDGEAITARTVVDSWMRALNASPAAWFYGVIEGVEAYLTGEAGPEAVQIEAVDEKTFKMTLVADLPSVVEGLANPAFSVIPMHAVEAHGAAWSMPDRIVVNGPFEIELWAPGDFIALAPNAHYWDAANVFLDAVIYFPVADPAEAFDMYRFGEVDWVGTVPRDKVAQVRQWDDFHQVPLLAAELEQIITEAASLEGEARIEALVKAEALFHALDAGDLPAYSFYSRNLIDTSVWGGWFPNKMGFHPIKDIYLK